ncbi:CPBP family intramembrane glutamic endopeptidase [uncultured Halopseudomonas sp.]|uniref:CPBP family intramembrane glutamic endopeptidase n=1 Tax=uncultured Halopseudomonas sp. TaxID=2901193 RepID=UPI0030ED44B8|tara:strand:+ start:34561 stop:35304 length:744 start_codon:yes stop_codon:yes gene_type:complete
MRQIIALPSPSRHALDDALILLRLAIAYAGLAAVSHWGAGQIMQRLGHHLHIDTQFLVLDALFTGLLMLGSLGVAWLLQQRDPLLWLTGRGFSPAGLIPALLLAVVMVVSANPLAAWLDVRLPAPDLLPENAALPRALTPLLELQNWRLLGALGVAVLWVPLAEEVIFRGWLFKALQRTRPGIWIALPASTLIFAMLHSFYSTGGVVVIALLGAGLGWLRWKYDQLWLCVVAHALYNGLTLLLVALN